MKKLIICLCCIVSIFSLVSCNKGKVSNDIKIEVSESTKFSKEEIDNAIKNVLKIILSFDAIYFNKDMV